MGKSLLLRLGIAGAATAVIILSSYYKGKDDGRKEHFRELLAIDSTLTKTVLNVIVEKVYERNFGKGLTRYGFGSDGRIYFSDINGMGIDTTIYGSRASFDSLLTYSKRLE